jgi:hypothetical protein
MLGSAQGLIEALEMNNGLRHALSAEPIQRPEQNAIELPLRGVVKQGRKLLSLLSTLSAAVVIDVLSTDYMA